MIGVTFKEVYTKFKLHYYRGIFGEVMERDGTLSAMEAFSVEIIYALGEPTIGEFAEYVGISKPNATYKVNSLMKKGYITKIHSQTDKREYHLQMTPKFFDYYSINDKYIQTVTKRIEKRFSKTEVRMLEQMMTVISKELMPEEEVPLKGDKKE